MNPTLFWTVSSLLYWQLSQIRAVGVVAWFLFYTPFVAVGLWLIYWSIGYVFSVAGGRGHKEAKTQKLEEGIRRLAHYCLYGILFLGCFVGIIRGLSELLPRGAGTTERGEVIKVKDGWVPLARHYSLRLLEIKKSNGRQTWVLVGHKGDNHFWIGQKVIFNRRKGASFMVSDVRFDSASWHRELLTKWPKARKAWRAIFAAERNEMTVEQIADFAKRYYQNFGFDSFVESIGNDFWIKHDLRSALKIYEALYDPNMAVYDHLKHYGFYLLKSGEVERGKKVLNRAIAMEPNRFDAYYQLGMVLFEQGHRDEALPALEKVLELRPESSDVRRILGK